MKRCFSLLVALVLLIALLPASSAMAGEEDCQHFLNQYKYYYYYRIIDAYTHEKTTEGRYYCPYCDIIFSYGAGCDIEVEGHTFSNGKCTLCGYKKTTSGSCTHTNTGDKLFGDKEYNQIPGDSTYHQLVRHYKITCHDCGKVIDEDYHGTTNEEHDFDRYGYCDKCGYEKSGSSYPSATATATPKPNTATQSASGFYVCSDVSVSAGHVTIRWVDSSNNGPYTVCYGLEDLEDQCLFGAYNIKGNQVTLDNIVPGARYVVFVEDSAGNFTKTAYLDIPAASSFVDGKLSASAIEIQIEYRYRASRSTAYADATKLDRLYASQMERWMSEGRLYGLRYTISLPQLAQTRYYETMRVFRAPYGFALAEYEGVKEYKSNNSRYWYCCGSDFFDNLLFECEYIPTGTYYVDLYWDGMWVNTTSFKVY